MQVSQLTPEQLAALDRLAEQEAGEIYQRTWLQHPDRMCNTVLGEMPKLVKATTSKRYGEMLSEGWAPASQEVMDAYAELLDIPGEVLLTEANRQKEHKAEQAILAYYGQQDPDQVPDKWAEKLAALKEKKSSGGARRSRASGENTTG